MSTGNITEAALRKIMQDTTRSKASASKDALRVKTPAEKLRDYLVMGSENAGLVSSMKSTTTKRVAGSFASTPEEDLEELTDEVEKAQNKRGLAYRPPIFKKGKPAAPLSPENSLIQRVEFILKNLRENAKIDIEETSNA